MAVDPIRELHLLIDQLSDEEAIALLADARRLAGRQRAPHELPTMHIAPPIADIDELVSDVSLLTRALTSLTRRFANGARKAVLSVAERRIDRCLIDTNIASYMLRGDTRAAPYRTYLNGKELGISFQTVAELRRWGIEREWSAARQRELARFINRLTVYYADDALLTAWAQITARLRRQGTPTSDADAWIASTAWVLNIPLVTHNRRHFEQINGLRIVSFSNLGQ